MGYGKGGTHRETGSPFNSYLLKEDGWTLKREPMTKTCMKMRTKEWVATGERRKSIHGRVGNGGENKMKQEVTR